MAPSRVHGNHGSPGIDVRLAQAADARQTLEVILVVRGAVRRTSRPGRWRIRMVGGGVLTFAADAVVAATPVARPGRR
jgi:hypothetical protein